jgi:hypothetical protein
MPQLHPSVRSRFYRQQALHGVGIDCCNAVIFPRI